MGSLEQDFVTVPGQTYALISLVGPECPQKSDKFGLKIRGVFPSKDEAGTHAKRLQREDNIMDIYVVDMYKWLLIPPQADKIEDVKYQDEKLEELMTKYKENQSDAARMFETRKRDMMAVKEEGEDMPFIKPGDENSKFYTKADEAPISHPADHIDGLKEKHPDATMEELTAMAQDIVNQEVEDRKQKRLDDAEKAKKEQEEAAGGSSSGSA
jgi:hypothetical protein